LRKDYVRGVLADLTVGGAPLRALLAGCVRMWGRWIGKVAGWRDFESS
jgi:hypothetical protein